jgi:hypothetical protein
MTATSRLWRSASVSTGAGSSVSSGGAAAASLASRAALSIKGALHLDLVERKRAALLAAYVRRLVEGKDKKA